MPPTLIEDAKSGATVRMIKRKTQSSGSVGFPDLTNIPNDIINSPAQLAEYVQSNSDSIKTIEMSFESKAHNQR